MGLCAYGSLCVMFHDILVRQLRGLGVVYGPSRAVFNEMVGR